jgi:hypothetical protein
MLQTLNQYMKTEAIEWDILCGRHERTLLQQPLSLCFSITADMIGRCFAMIVIKRYHMGRYHGDKVSHAGAWEGGC